MPPPNSRTATVYSPPSRELSFGLPLRLRNCPLHDRHLRNRRLRNRLSAIALSAIALSAIALSAIALFTIALFTIAAPCGSSDYSNSTSPKNWGTWKFGFSVRIGCHDRK